MKTPGARAPRPRKITPAQLEQIRERTRLLHNQAMDRLVRAEPPEIRRQPRVRSAAGAADAHPREVAMTESVSGARVNRMLTHMRAFQKLPGRWDEGEKGRVHARFQAAWDSATVSERQRYQTTIHREILARAPVRQPAAVVDLAARRRQSRQQPPTGRSR